MQYYLPLSTGYQKPNYCQKASVFGPLVFRIAEHAPNIAVSRVVGYGVTSLALKENPDRNVIVFYYTLILKMAQQNNKTEVTTKELLIATGP